MVFKLYIAKIGCHILEDSLRGVKLLMYIWKNIIFMHQINSIMYLQYFWTNLKTPLAITQQTSLELILVYHLLN